MAGPLNPEWLVEKKVFATVVIGRGQLPIFELWGVWI